MRLHYLIEYILCWFIAGLIWMGGDDNIYVTAFLLMGHISICTGRIEKVLDETI